MIVVMGLSCILTLFYFLLMLRYLYGWLKLKPFKKPDNFQPSTFVSVIVPARNEEQNIENCLNHLLLQNYPNELFEIVVVDDFSEDDTGAVVRKIASSNQKISFISLGDDTSLVSSTSHKKKALEAGIKVAKGSLIITTDADCTAEISWLGTIVSFFEKYKPKMIAAPVAVAGDKSLLQKFEATDVTGMMGITGGSIALGSPVLANGANLAFEREVFYECGGYAATGENPSGDDMFLMLKVEQKYSGEVRFLKSAEAVVTTKAQPDFQSLLQQRLRWASKNDSYPKKSITWILGAIFLFHLFIIINLTFSIFLTDIYFLAAAVAMIAGKATVDFLLLFTLLHFFRRKKLLLYFLPNLLLHILYIVVVPVLSVFKSYRWKGRKWNARILGRS